MDSTSPAPADDSSGLRTAPEHVIDLVLSVMRPYGGPVGPPPGSVPYARAARAEAKIYADRIWAEATAVGAAWALARSAAPIRIEVTAEQRDQIVRDLG